MPQQDVPATGHSGGTATCEDPAACESCGEAYGDLADHNYVDGKCTVCEASEGDAPVLEEKTAELSFADKTTNRTAYSTTQQIWAQNGITFTNDKASSTTNVADYAAPVRLYKSSTVTINCTNMTKIVFNCSSNSYATALGNSFGTNSNYTVSVDSKVVTVTFTNAQDVVTATMSAQIRIDSLVVTYLG